MEQNDPNLPPTTFCRSGCGFYGSESFEGLCSKCYKDQIKRKNQSSSPVSSAGRASPAAPSLSAIGISSGSLQGEKDINCVSQALAKTNIGGLQQETGLASSNSPATSLNVSSTTPSVETATTTIQVPHVDKDSEESEAGAVGGAGCNDVAGMSPDTSKDKKKKNRCHTCKKKVGLTGFQCRCGGMFCSLHRYSDKHECTFNYKEMAQQQIRKNNPVIVGEKIAKI